MIELNKIECRRNVVGTILATVYIATDEWAKVTRDELVTLKRRLEKDDSSQLRDFGSVRMDGPPVHYEVSVALGLYAKEWEEMEELIRFRNEIEKMARIACCIDCSALTPRTPCSVAKHRQKKTVPA